MYVTETGAVYDVITLLDSVSSDLEHLRQGLETEDPVLEIKCVLSNVKGFLNPNTRYAI